MVWNVLHGANDVTHGAEQDLEDHSRSQSRHRVAPGKLRHQWRTPKARRMASREAGMESAPSAEHTSVRADAVEDRNHLLSP